MYEYCIMGPDKQIASKYAIEDGNVPVIYGFDQGIKAGIYDDLEIDLSVLKIRRG